MIWDNIRQQSADTAGIALFTVMKFDAETRLSRRFYSSMPDVYPVDGTKEASASAWSRCVLEQKQNFIGNSLAELDAVFPDTALIGSLGLGSCINIPIVHNDAAIGTLNFLREPGGLTSDVVQTLTSLVDAHRETIVTDIISKELTP